MINGKWCSLLRDLCLILIKINCNEDIHNSWLYCFTNILELGTCVSLSHRQSADDAKAKHMSQVQEY